NGIPWVEVRVPERALYGPQTQRAVENFPISGLRLPRSFLRALGLIKAAAAKVNGDLGELPPQSAAAVEAAAIELMEGVHDSHLPLQQCRPPVGPPWGRRRDCSSTAVSRLRMVCAQVIGYDAAIAWCAGAGNFELSVMTPVMAYDLLETEESPASATQNFSER